MSKLSIAYSVLALIQINGWVTCFYPGTGSTWSYLIASLQVQYLYRSLWSFTFCQASIGWASVSSHANSLTKCAKANIINNIQFHRLAEKYGLKAGDGPTEEVMTNGFFKVINVARTIDNKMFAKTTMTARGDPGELLLLYSADTSVHAEVLWSHPINRLSRYLRHAVRNGFSARTWLWPAYWHCQTRRTSNSCVCPTSVCISTWLDTDARIRICRTVFEPEHLKERFVKTGRFDFKTDLVDHPWWYFQTLKFMPLQCCMCFLSLSLCEAEGTEIGGACYRESAAYM